MGAHLTSPVSLLLPSQFHIAVLFPDHVRLTTISRYGTTTKLSTDDDIAKRTDDSVNMLRTHLDKGRVVYGKSYRCLDL
jgi:hypothetical protein